jgi:hypothetical protein
VSVFSDKMTLLLAAGCFFDVISSLAAGGGLNFFDIKEELKKVNYKVHIAPSDLIHFGGQISFDMIHQLFIQHKGEFIFMSKLCNLLFSIPLLYPREL